MKSLSTIEMISASAGTGKTYRLTELIAEAVTSGTAPERIMATTFTVKAAKELRARVRGRLMSEVAPDLAPRIEDAYIGTVHSLCSRLLSEYAIDAGISPALDMLPEQDAERLFNVAVEEAISSHSEDIEPAARRLERTGQGYGYGQQEDWQSDVRELVRVARANGFEPKALQAEAESCLKLWWQAVAGLGKSGNGEPTGASLEKLVESVETALEQLSAIQEPKKGTINASTFLEDVRNRYTGGEEIQWSDWLKLSQIQGAKEAELILDDVRQVATRLFRNTEFRNDFETLVTGAYRCAGEALILFDGYKRSRGLMDFDDLEVFVLELLQRNESVRDGLRNRVDLVLIDEFQDTSPVQLAIFLQLQDIIGRSIWVGDPKQAIYGFRGTDPSLMSSVAGHLQTRETLQNSWRSRKRLLDFTNAIFTQAFHQIPKERVLLRIPEKRSQSATGGTVSAWYLDSKNAGQDADAIATGVVELLEARPELHPGDVALLCRTNPSCRSVAEALEARGVRAGVASGSLTEAREVQLLLAALRFLADSNDTIALTELILLTPEKSSNESDEHLLSALIEKPQETITDWRRRPVPQSIEQVRSMRERLSPRELLDAVIAAVDAMDAANRWSRSDLRRANIETLRRLVDEYEELRRTSYSPATLQGFLGYLDDLDAKQAEGDASTACVVSTYHGAKGLEWPVVIMADLNKNYVGRIFGVTTVPAPQFDPMEPLANRGIRYWPWPFGSLRKAEILQDSLEAIPEYEEILITQRDESKRLLYVGMTRARDHLILALRNPKKKELANPGDEWVRLLTDDGGAPLIEWPSKEGNVSLRIGTESVPVEIRVCDPESGTQLSRAQETAVRRPVIPAAATDDAGGPAPPRWVTPSNAVTGTAAAFNAVELARIGQAIELAADEAATDRNPESTDLGNAVHAVLALAPAFRGRDPGLVEAKIASILEGWGVSGIDAMAARGACGALDSFVWNRYGRGAEYHEWPVHMRLPNHQELRGWIDLLVDTPEGWVIIDHKAYHGDQPADVAASYGQQLRWYREAVQEAQGRPVKESLIHFPLLGRVFRVDESDE